MASGFVENRMFQSETAGSEIYLHVWARMMGKGAKCSKAKYVKEYDTDELSYFELIRFSLY